ncbi:MAG: polysaccharide biosynthesis tyrosine autokinase [Verrucomicrobia bacterium]|nr:polysaccharide biosynthesis tyrosine autokinase [Verrucomicrobiota bacterium]
MNSSPVHPPQAEQDKLHFLDYWQVIAKRKEVIIATAVILIFAVTVYSFVVRSEYTATAQIRIDTPAANTNPFGGPMAELYTRPLDEAEYNTHQIQITSDPVLRRVIEGRLSEGQWICDTCGREYSEEEVERLGELSCISHGCDGRIRRESGEKYPTWVPLNETWARFDNEPEKYDTGYAIYLLRKRVRVRPERGTRLINISYTSPDQNEVATVANMVAQVYQQEQEDQSKRKVRRALSALLEEIEDLRRGGAGPNAKGLDQLEKERDQFKKDNALIFTNQGVLEHMDLNQWRAERLRLEVQIASRTERLKQLEGLQKEELIDALQGDQSLYDYKRMKAQQEISLKQALVDYGVSHDAVTRLTESIADLQSKIEKQADGVLNALRIDLAGFLIEKAKLDERIAKLELDIYTKEEAMTKYRRLSDEVERLRAIYDQITAKKVTETIKQAIPESQVVITQNASPPMTPSKPNRMVNIIIGVVVGLTVGTGLAYFIEYLDTSVKTIDDLERSLAMPILGVIPQRVKLLTEVTHKSPAYEAYRMLWTNIDFARQESKLRTLLVTSGGVGEGKTTSLANLAIVAAREGNKVLVIDSDFRRPRVHKLFGISNHEGLTDVLLRSVDPDRVCIETKVPNLWVMPSGKLPPSAMGLLNSRNMRECIEYLHDRYDIILFDSPPVIGVSDASVLAGLVDRIVLVVEYRKYPKTVATRAKRILENVGGKILGGVINNLNIIKEDYYYYSQVYHYFQASGEDAEDQEATDATPADEASASSDESESENKG